MVQRTLGDRMNARGIRERASVFARGKKAHRWKDKNQNDQGSMVQKLPPFKRNLKDPLFAAEIRDLKAYQGNVRGLSSDWEENVADVPMLHKVCFEGYLSTARELLENGDRVDQVITDGPKIMRFLHGGFETHTVFFLESTPLMMAAHQGHLPIVKLLLRHNASVEQRDSLGNTAFSLAVANKRMDACRLLQKNGANVNNVDKKHNFTPLILACRKNDTELAAWLIRKGANAKQHDCFGRTALHYAAWNFNHEIIRMLLNLHLDVNGRDFYGWSPIHLVVGDFAIDPTHEGNKSLETIEVKRRIHRGFGKGGEEWQTLVALLDNGADPDHMDPTGNTPLHILANRLPTAVLSDGLVNVSDRKKNEMLLISMMLLIDKNANVNCVGKDGLSVMDVCRSRQNFMADRLFDELSHSVSLTSLHTPSVSTSMGSVATTATMGFHRHFSVDAMEEEIRQLVDMLLIKFAPHKRKGLRRRYDKGCLIS